MEHLNINNIPHVDGKKLLEEAAEIYNKQINKDI